MRFGHFFEDLGHDTAQTPALLNLNTDAVSDSFSGIEVIQIGHVGLWTVLLDSFAHGQFDERLTKVEHFVAVRHFSGAENILRQGTEQ
ncbi:hypothetical protein D3C72_582410 [compost metagenome]